MDSISISIVVGLLYEIGDKMVDKYDYSFVVTTYNQQNTIVETLESIKYQVEKYGTDFKVQLIIGDDGSTDKNVEVIKKWLIQNKHYFTEVVTIFEDNNYGMCHNFCSTLEKVRGRHFKEISGDDILPENNIFSVMDKLDDCDIVTGIVLRFKDGKFILDKSEYITEIRQAFFSYKEIRKLSKTAVPLKGGTIWNKNLDTKSLFEYIKQYKLVEDRPLWYKITKDNKELQYWFENSPVLLYRIGGGSSIHSNVNKIHMEDIKKLYLSIKKEKLTLLERESLFCVMHGLKYLDFGVLYVKIKDLLYHKKMDELWNNLFVPSIYRNQKYIEYIKQQSEAFYIREGLYE